MARASLFYTTELTRKDPRRNLQVGHVLKLSLASETNQWPSEFQNFDLHGKQQIKKLGGGGLCFREVKRRDVTGEYQLLRTHVQ